MSITLASRERDRDGLSDVVRYAVARGFPPAACVLVDDAVRARELAEILLARGPLVGVEIMTLSEAEEALVGGPSPLARALAAHALAVAHGALEPLATPRRAVDLARWLEERVAPRDGNPREVPRCPISIPAEVEEELVAAYRHSVGAPGHEAGVRPPTFAAHAFVRGASDARLLVACEARWWRDPRWPPIWDASSHRGVEVVLAEPDESGLSGAHQLERWLSGRATHLPPRTDEGSPGDCATVATLDDTRLDEVERIAETLRWEVAHGLDAGRAVVVAARPEDYRTLLLEVVPRAGLSVAPVDPLPLDRTPAGRLTLDVLELVADGFRLPALLRFLAACDVEPLGSEPIEPVRGRPPLAQWIGDEWARARGDWGALLGRLRSATATETAPEGAPSDAERHVLAILDALDRLDRPAPPIELARELGRLLADSGALRVLARPSWSGRSGGFAGLRDAFPADARERASAISETHRRVEWVARWLATESRSILAGRSATPGPEIRAADLLAPVAIALAFPGPLVAPPPDAVRFAGLDRLPSLSRVERVFIVGLDDDAAQGPTFPRSSADVAGWLARIGAGHASAVTLSAPRRQGDRELLAPTWLEDLVATRPDPTTPARNTGPPGADATPGGHPLPTRTYALDRCLGAACRLGTVDPPLLTAATRPGGRPRSAALAGAWVEAVRRSAARSPYAGWLAGTSAWNARADAPVWSATKLERYARCPFRYFAHDVLRVAEPASLGRDVPLGEVGTIVHAALCRAGHALREATARAAADALSEDHDDVYAWVRQEVLAIAGAEIHRGFDALDHCAPVFRDRRKEQALATLSRFVAQELDLARASSSRLAPRFFELAFGVDRPGLDVASGSIEVGDTGVWLSGSIDRIDVAPIDDARATASNAAAPTLAALICDYKTGRVPDSHQIENGLGFQLPLYLLVAPRLLAARGVGDRTVAAVAGRYFQVKSPIDWGWKGGVGDRDRARELGVALPKEGDLDPEGFARLLDGYRDALVSLTRHRARGDFATGPLHPVTLECRTCPYATCCRADPDHAAWRARDAERGATDEWLPRRLASRHPEPDAADPDEAVE